MKKTAFTLTAMMVVLFAFQSNAQISLNGTVGMFKSTESGSDAQWGLNVSGKYNLNDNMRIGANIGYYSRSETFLNNTLTSSTTPITGLFEYSFSKDGLAPYVGADLGFYSFAISGGGASFSKSYFGFAPVVGLDYGINDKISINANYKFHYIMSDVESTSINGINAGVSYKF